MTRVVSDIGRYCMVPKWVAERLVGQDEALALWVGLALLANDADRSLTRSRTNLAKAVGISVSSFDRRVERLLDAGVLEVETDVDGPIRRPSTYLLVMAEPPVQSTFISDGALSSERTSRTATTKNQPLDHGVSSSPTPSTSVLPTLAPPARATDPIFEALFFLDAGLPYSREARATLTRTSLAAINAAAQEIRQTGITRDELELAIMSWPSVMGDVVCTANAVKKHLPRLRAASNGIVARRETTDLDDAVAATARLRAAGER